MPSRKVLTGVALALLSAAVTCDSKFDESPAAFEAFVRRFDKSYSTEEARAAAYANFVQHMRDAAEMEARNPHAKFGLTRRADKPMKAPLKKRGALLGKESTARRPEGRDRQLLDTPPSIWDWRQKAMVTPVPNQGECGGACVTFTYTGVGSAVNALRGYSNGLVELSSQQLIDCSNECGCDSGCLIESPVTDLIDKNNGLWDSAASYPFTGEDGTCMQKNASVHPAARLIALVSLPKKDESALVQGLLQSPVGVPVYAMGWETYTGGVLTDCNVPPNGSVDDSALLVGYNDESEPPYWIVRTNWGTDFGEDGYIYLAKGNNTCLIQDDPFTLELGPL